MNSLTPENEADLVQRARQGDQKAFAALVNDYQDKALRTAFSYLHNWEDAREAAQDAFVRAFSALSKFEGTSRFSTWFYRILVNRCQDVWKRKKMHTVGLDESSEVESCERPDRRLLSGEILDQIHRHLVQLPDQQRHVFTLRYFEDMPLKEMAEIMSLSEGAVKAHLWQAGQKMKSALSRYIET